ncbi:hypothetical protein POVCU2_0075310 [Plasmodium ovale curtisi]|uniref:Uncharacterized protein n=1 Tax=Plasmodium ovale curtisi TaxID=864141 RepID=A0A1A8VTV1_PLAOA|nr:hypothetical protein POVCU1_006930 [Plasmodium ovale curtisi]SBS92628.1 hypothetical protein POVCU2_0075310 [Plasmodium ovale curtisi]
MPTSTCTKGCAFSHACPLFAFTPVVPSSTKYSLNYFPTFPRTVVFANMKSENKNGVQMWKKMGYKRGKKWGTNAAKKWGTNAAKKWGTNAAKKWGTNVAKNGIQNE